MPPGKRNHFLDADESEDDRSQGYDSEAEELTKGGRSAKRRKVESDSEGEYDLSGDDLQEDAGSPTEQLRLESEKFSQEEDADEHDGDDQHAAKAEKKPGKSEPKLREDPTVHPAKKNLVVTAAQIKKSGVIYLSRIPPFMKPAKLRSLLQPYGKINRIFLSPEDPDARRRRVKAGGNKRRNFTDGWVEFVNKKDAKLVCEVLNGQTIGGKKGSFYRDDIWTLLYLRGFKWHNLTEQIASENAERESRMRAEISKATRENREFVRNVERAKVLDGMQAKKAAKQSRTGPQEGSGADGGDAATAAVTGLETVDGAAQEAWKPREKPRTFTQVPVASKKGAVEPTDQVQRVLSKIF